MAYDIGPKIGIEGEAEFRKQINNITQTMRTLGTEMKAVSSEFIGNENSMEAYTAKTDVLNKQIDTQKQKLDLLQQGLQAVANKYGEADSKTQRWQQAVNTATADLNKLEAELRSNNSAMDALANDTEDAAGSTDKLSEAMEDAADNTGVLSKGLDAATIAVGNLVAKGIETAVSAIIDMVGALWNLDEATEEYRIAQGKLQTAFEAAGYSVEDAEKAYTEFYKILGDIDTATEASQLLAQLADNEEDLSEWTNIAAGVYGTFGDALPIEGLIEAANETAKVGEVTGTLADALNWAGISEDEFNEKLAACSSESERNNLIMQTLSQTYDEASEAFYRNNESIIAAREAQAQLDDTLAGLGETIANVKNSIASELVPSIASIIEAFNGIITGAEGADTAFADAIAGLSEKITAMLPQFIETGTQIVVSIVSGIIQSLPSIIEGATDAIITFAEALTDENNLSMILSAGLELIVKLTEGILKAIPKIVDALPEIVDSIVQFLLFDSRDQMAQAGADLFIALVENLPAAIVAIQKMIPEIIIAILAAIGEGVADMAAAGVEWGENLIGGFVEGIKSKIRSVQDAVKGVISAAAEFIGFHSPAKKGEGRYIVDWGANMISGFLDGVDSMLGDVSNMGNNVTAQMASALSQPTTAAASGITLTANISVGSIRNDQDIKAISTALNRQVRNWGRSLGVV